MKVLLIDVNCKSSSTGQIVYNLCSYLNSHGDEAMVCYGRGQLIKEKSIFKFGLDWETYLHAFLTRLTGYTGCFSFFSTRRLIRRIEAFKPDVVHIHELHAYFVNIKQLLRYLANRNIKVVHTLHCEFSYTGKCGHSIDCQKWKQECGHCPHLRSYPASLLFDHTKRMQRTKKKAFSMINDLTIITPSDWLTTRTKESFLSNRTIKTINNGIDTHVFRPVDSKRLKDELCIRDNEKIVISIAPNILSKEKGGYEVLSIANDLKKYNIRFVLVGIENDNIDLQLPNVILKQKIYDKKLLAEYYSMADLFVICSERENFPTTCIEAQACGTPLCGYSTGGTIETSVYSGNQFVPYGSREELGRIILDFPRKNEEVSTVISNLSVERFENEKVFERVKRLY